MDALSEALSAVHMTGAIFYHAECRAPWGFAVPATQQVAHILAPGTERLVTYHLVVEGQAIVRFEGREDVLIEAGDVIIIPHGDAHTVSDGVPKQLINSADSLKKFLSGELAMMRLDGDGALTQFVCGYFGCERHADRLFLAGLPRMIKIGLRGDPTGEWLEGSVRHLASEAGSPRAGNSVLLSRMADALFIEAMRRYMEGLPPEETGWLAGARDAVVGGALALMHREPFHPWTLDELAARSGASRSLLAKRFVRFLGDPPLSYLARWRLQLAARRLQTTRKTVLQVASDVGYESEAAFNRAFKREFGLPPAQYRRKLAGNGTLQGVERGRSRADLC